MKKQSLILVVGVMMALFSACQVESLTPAVPEPEASPTPSQVAPTSEAEPYPEPDQPVPTVGPVEPDAYPEPGAEVPQATAPSGGEMPYPGPENGEVVAWDQAVDLIQSGDAAQVFQTHARQVTITMNDGRTFVTTEPNLDDVFEVIENCGDPCSDIVIATE